MCRLCALAWLAAQWLKPTLLPPPLLSRHAILTPPPLGLLHCPRIVPSSFAVPHVKPACSVCFISCRTRGVRTDVKAEVRSTIMKGTYPELQAVGDGQTDVGWGLGCPLLKMPRYIDCMPPRAVLGEPRHRGSICSTNALVWRSQGRVRLTSDRELLGTSFAGEASRYDPSVMLAPSASR